MTLSKNTARPEFATPPQRILIIKPSAIGDVVHALPILNLLRKRWPAAHISWLITPGCAGLLQGHPQIDELIPFDRKMFGKSWKSVAVAQKLIAFGLTLHRKKFDLVIDLQGLFRSGLLTIQTGAKYRVGSTSAREFGWVFCTHLAPLDTWNKHAVERYLSVAEFLGLGQSPVEFIFPTDDTDRSYVRDLLSGAQMRDAQPGQFVAATPASPNGFSSKNGDAGIAATNRLPTGESDAGGHEPFAVLLPTTHWETKRWPVEQFAALVQPLQTRFGLKSVVAGDPAAGALSIPGALNLGGKTTLGQLVALLERASLVIANDTGPMHIAAALGRPLVTMFGPTSPIQTGPYQRMNSVIQLDIPCSPCFSRSCAHRSCLTMLEIEPVLKLAAEQLSAGKPNRS